MEKLKNEIPYLNATERFIVVISAVIFWIFSVFLVFSPPIRQTIVNDSVAIQTTTAFSDQSTVVIVLMTVGSILFFYAINGLRLNKFTAGPISGESVSGQGSIQSLGSSIQVKNKLEANGGDHKILFDSLTDDEKKILRTLWRYQRSTFHDDISKRWTFKIFTNNPEYPSFLTGLGELLKKGFVSVNPENEQCALTNEGIILLTQIGEKADTGDYYLF